MKNNFEKLFERTHIGKHGVKNRFVYAPMGIGYNYASGCIDDPGIEYYSERARGGVGMLNIGFQNVSNKLDPMMMQAYGIGTPMQEMGWARLCERVHGYGTSVMVQLSCGLGRCAQVIPGVPNVSASVNNNFWDPSTQTRALSTEEVRAIPGCFEAAAAACKRAGVDCIEIHGHVGYLLDQFMTPLWNRREDEYGPQSFENKMRLTTEIYEACRKAVGPDYPIVFRMVIEHNIPGGRTREESAEIIRYLDGLGVDAFDVDMGCYDAYEWIFPTAYMEDGCMVDDAGAFAKSITDKPVFTVGSHTPETALKAVEEGKSDFIVVGRGMLADPEFANKLYYGHREDIRPCIKCNRYCLSATGRSCDSSCSVNPQVLHEKTYAITKKPVSRNIAVIGGGVAGMEAARVAALSGHSVTIYERSGGLGGQLIPAAAPSFKNRIQMLNDYYQVQLKKLGVSIVYNKEIHADSPELKHAYKIIVATGAKAAIPPIPGIHNENVMEVSNLHRSGSSVSGQKVIIAGGGPSGCDCALELAMEGKEVTIIEMLPKLYPTATVDNRYSVERRIREENICVMTGTKIKELTPSGAIVENADGVQELHAETVILALCMKQYHEFANCIADKYVNAVIIGDCKAIGQIGEAVHDGFMAGWTIE